VDDADKAKPDPEWLELLTSDAEVLSQASSQGEWNDVVSAILERWICMGRPGLLLARERAPLTEAVRQGFKPKPHRMKKALQARSDANLILRNMTDRPFVTVNGKPRPRAVRVVTLADAAHCIASVERVPLDAARKRAQEAEAELGFRLPRAAPFGKKRPPSFR
jgi:hypothetical protein